MPKTPSQQAEELVQKEAELLNLIKEEEYAECERSLYAYFCVAWQLFDSAPLKTNWHIGAIADHVQACYKGQIRNLLVNVPPGSAKSSLISVAAPTWYWGPYNAPQTKYITASYGTARGTDPATRDSIRSRRLIQTDWYQRRWGDRFRLMIDQNQKTAYENDKGGSRLATSIGGVGTGIHYDILQVDDPMKAQDADSSAAIERVNEWWSGTMSTRQRDYETSRKLVIMQRLSEKDLTGFIKEREEENWTVLNIPMEYEPTKHVSVLGWKDPRKVPGELMFPERFDRDVVNSLKKQLGPYKYAAQYQQRPAPAEGGKVKRDWLTIVYAPLPHYDILIQAWDLSMDDTENADFTVGEVWGKKGADRHLLDVVRGRMDVIDQAKAIANTYNKWKKTRAILVENKANGPAVIKMLKSKERSESSVFNCPTLAFNVVFDCRKGSAANRSNKIAVSP